MQESMDPKLYVNPGDLSGLKFYRQAAKEILQRANTEDSEIEKKRLILVAKSHLKEIDWILGKYNF